MKISVKFTALLFTVLLVSAPLFSCANNTTPPVTEPTTDPVTEPITDPVTKPVTDPVTEPITEPITEPVTEPITEPTTEPVTEPTVPEKHVVSGIDMGNSMHVDNSMPYVTKFSSWDEDYTLQRGSDFWYGDYTGPTAKVTITYSPNFKVLTIPDSVETLYLEIDEFSAIEKIVGIEHLSQLYISIFEGNPMSSDPKHEENGAVYIGNLLVSFIGDTEHLTVRDGTRFIASSAFENCTDLKAVALPDSLETIFDYAFKNSGVTELVIPNGVTYLSYRAFDGASSLKSLTLSSSAKKLRISLLGTPKLETLSGLEGLESLELAWDETSPIFTDKTRWEDGALYIEGVLLAVDNASGIESLTVKAGTRVIAQNACQNIDSLKRVTIPDGIERIDEFSFNGCDDLTVVNVPASVKTVGRYAFGGCKALESITLSLGVTEIGDHAFSGCDALKTVTLPSTLLSIGREAFSPSGVREINLPDGLVSIGYKAFYGCSSLESITVPDSVTDFGKYVFIGCSSLKNATIPARLLGEAYLFAQCSSLEDVTLFPAELGDCHSIGDCAFAECASLKSFDIPFGITEIEPYAFYKCEKLEPSAFPETLAEIQINAFTECPNFISIDLPDGIKADEHAFGDRADCLRQVRQAMLPWYIPHDPGYETFRFSWNGHLIK